MYSEFSITHYLHGDCQRECFKIKDRNTRQMQDILNPVNMLSQQYQFYAKTLGIELIFAHKARTKGKIEKFFRFVQRDFVRENTDVRSLEELNRRFFTWQIKYNEGFKHSGIGMNGKTPAQVYQPSTIRRPKQELQELLTITIRRLVYRDSTISLFGKRYKVPNEFITTRMWARIRGETVRIESMGRVVYKFRLRV